MSDRNKIAWVDVETTGLDKVSCHLLEVAIVITDFDLNIIAESPSWVIANDRHTLDQMDEWCKTTHFKSGLLKEVCDSKLTLEMFVDEAMSFLKANIQNDGIVPMGGFSVGFDRDFLKHHAPVIESYFNYRNIDVSSIRELLKRWKPEIADLPVKRTATHRAKSDIIDSIDTLKYYKRMFGL